MRWNGVGGWCFFHSMIHPFMIPQKMWTVFLYCFSLWKKRENTEKKGIYFHCDSTTHIWLPNHKSVIFFFTAAPISIQLQHFSAMSLWTTVCFLLLGAWGTGAAALSVTGVNNSISTQPQSPHTHAGFSGTVLDSIAWEQSKSSQNSSFHAKCPPRWIPLVLCNFQANFQANRNKTKHSNVSVFHRAC